MLEIKVQIELIKSIPFYYCMKRRRSFEVHTNKENPSVLYNLSKEIQKDITKIFNESRINRGLFRVSSSLINALFFVDKRDEGDYYLFVNQMTEDQLEFAISLFESNHDWQKEGF